MATNLFHFEKPTSKEHEDLIFKWLAEPHLQEFWYNSNEHKEDIKNFIHGRKQHYFYGTTQYWIGYTNNQPFCFILTDEIFPSQEMSEAHRTHLSKTGHTHCLDFGIGNTAYLGKKVSAQSRPPLSGNDFLKWKGSSASIWSTEVAAGKCVNA